MSGHTERSTLAACVASLLGVAAADVPLEGDSLRSWLAERGLGLVPVDEPASFAWAGPWIAWRASRTGGGRRALMMFGVPSGVLWDPAGTRGPILAGALLAPLDVARWRPAAEPAAGTGTIAAILLAPRAEAPMAEVTHARAIAGRGLEGDRYAAGCGTFASGRPGSALTLIEAAVVEELRRDHGASVDCRRNVVVAGANLNALVGRRFRLGAAVCEGRRLCEPCAHLDAVNGVRLLPSLVHRGGLRADVVSTGEIRRGDALLVI